MSGFERFRPIRAGCTGAPGSRQRSRVASAMRSVQGKPSETDPVDAEAVREALGRILASANFLASERNKRFLSFVVEETLSGRSDRIKAYTIAVDVFNRDESFDAVADPLIRIEAS